MLKDIHRISDYRYDSKVTSTNTQSEHSLVFAFYLIKP